LLKSGFQAKGIMPDDFFRWLKKELLCLSRVFQGALIPGEGKCNNIEEEVQEWAIAAGGCV
jgi:hypothetical protein